MKTFTFQGTPLRWTDKSVLMDITIVCPDPVGSGFVEADRQVWLPLRFVDECTDESTLGRWRIPMWLARDRDMVGGTLGSRFSVYYEAV